MRNLERNDTNEHTYKIERDTDFENELMVARGEQLGKGYCIPFYAAAAKSLQSCPTLCDPIGGSPQGSPVPGTQ